MKENSIEEDIEILDLCKEKKCELAMIDKSIEYLRRNKWKIV